jgi:hypothetical protein
MERSVLGGHAAQRILIDGWAAIGKLGVRGDQFGLLGVALQLLEEEENESGHRSLVCCFRVKATQVVVLTSVTKATTRNQ